MTTSPCAGSLAGLGERPSVYLTNTVEVAGVTIEMWADFGNGSGPWTFVGGTGPGQEIHIGDLVAGVAGVAETIDAVAVPDALASVVIENLAACFDTGTKDFSFAGEAKLTVGHVTLDVVVAILYQLVDDTYQGSLDARLSLAGVEMDLTIDQVDGGVDARAATGAGQDIPIGTLLKDAASLVGVISLPPVLENVTLTTLTVGLNTASETYSISGEAALALDGFHLDVGLVLERADGASSLTATLQLGGGLSLKMAFDVDSAADRFVAVLTDTGKISLHDAFGGLSDELAALIPAGLTIEVDALLVAVVKDAIGTRLAFGAELGGDVDLSDLPLVGSSLPAGTLGLGEMWIWAATGPIQEATFAGIQPELAELGFTGPLPAGLERGVQLAANLTLHGTVEAITAGIAADGGGSPATTGAPPPAASPPDDIYDKAKWVNLQRWVGPVQFQRVGFAYDGGVVWLLLDAALSVAGMTLSLQGLAAGCTIAGFDPLHPDLHFDLQGLGLDYRSGPLEIGGALLRKGDEYDGEATLQVGEFGLSAIGSYATVCGQPSLFVYGVADYPFGGPPYAYVLGLAAGFGVNRSFTTPSAGDVPSFPLVEEAEGRAKPAGDLAGELARLDRYLAPAAGDVFLAIGARFTTFDLLDTVALLVVAFGDEFEVDVLGLSTMVVPSEGPTLAEIQMGLAARFVPAEGLLAVAAQLTSNSYVLSKDCHLTGGYAFSTWFAGPHEGDFVQSMGGYHPKFDAPDHYPSVPRLGVSWKIDGHTSVSGTAYYALVPSLLMAGGSLKVSWASGSLSASLTASADFVIGWQPYHYDASMHVSVHAAYTYHFFGTHHITADLGVGLHIWGPEFAGKLHVDLEVTSFDVRFGSSSANKPEPISWQQFEDAFLPDDIVTISVASGLIRRIGDVWVVNPKELVVQAATVIPAGDGIGSGPMGLTADQFDAPLDVTITRDGDPDTNAFTLTAAQGGVPGGMWAPASKAGHATVAGIGSDPAPIQATTGYTISPAKPPAPGHTDAVDRSELKFTLEEPVMGFAWSSGATAAAASGSEPPGDFLLPPQLVEVTAHG